MKTILYYWNSNRKMRGIWTCVYWLFFVWFYLSEIVLLLLWFLVLLLRYYYCWTIPTFSEGCACVIILSANIFIFADLSIHQNKIASTSLIINWLFWWFSRRKKRCIRYIESGGDSGNQSDDNQSNGSLGGHSDNEEADSVSSPGGLSALSSLTSPGMLTQASLSPATPLTPHVSEYECPMSVRMPLAVVVPTRHHQPVGTNPHDINNPLSVNQLTGGVNNKCHPKEQSDLKTGVTQQQQQSEQHPNSRPLPAISVT